MAIQLQATMTSANECVVRDPFHRTTAVVVRGPSEVWETEAIGGLGGARFADQATLPDALEAIARWGDDRVTLVG